MRPSRFFWVILVPLTLLAIASSSAAQTVTTLYSFSGQNSSGIPGLVVPAQGRDGRLYGTTFGPSGSAGSIFKASTIAGITQLYTFGSDGSNPESGLTLATDGNFYGTTLSGGTSNNGVLFKITPSGVYTVLHEFAGGTDGAAPYAPPIEASDDSLYGTTSGTSGASTVYKYSQGIISTIYSFDQAHGQSVIGALVQASDGNLYGTAEFGGANNCGTIFKVATSGTLLWSYSFPCGSPGGAYPTAGLVQASDGNFYGTTDAGGNPLGFGTIFKLSQSGNVSNLYVFKSLPDGGNPIGGLLEATDGNLYGATLGGGEFNEGTIFQVSTNGVHKVLCSLSLKLGEQPLATLLQHTNGKFYGAAQLGGKFNSGTIYSLDMGLGAFVTFVLPVGTVGQTAQILGQGLTGTTSVTFNGVPATSFKVANDTFMTAVVPSGATTGKVVVTTPSGALTSNVNFRVVN
jgi:uncharacterized repeat protein (TIGR03803 family)